jgi:hypothetical protein
MSLAVGNDSIDQTSTIRKLGALRIAPEDRNFTVVRYTSSEYESHDLNL